MKTYQNWNIGGWRIINGASRLLLKDQDTRTIVGVVRYCHRGIINLHGSRCIGAAIGQRLSHAQCSGVVLRYNLRYVRRIDARQIILCGGAYLTGQCIQLPLSPWQNLKWRANLLEMFTRLLQNRNKHLKHILGTYIQRKKRKKKRCLSNSGKISEVKLQTCCVTCWDWACCSCWTANCAAFACCAWRDS